MTLQTGIGVLRRRIGGFGGENVMNRGGQGCRAGGGEPEKFFRKWIVEELEFFLLRMDREKNFQRWMGKNFSGCS